MSLPSEFDELAKKEKPRKPRKCEPESKVKKDIKKAFAEVVPDMWWYMPVQGVEGENGIPDFVGCCPVTITPGMVGKTYGLFVSIEAKADDGPIRTSQVNCIKDIRTARGVAWVVRGMAGAKKLREKLRELINAAR